jgi:hypothetical protein
MAERCQKAALLMGDNLEIAFTIDNNDHSEYGGLELSLRDFQSRPKAASTGEKSDDDKITVPLDLKNLPVASP